MTLLTLTQQGYWDGAAFLTAGDQQASEPTLRAGFVFSGATLGESRLLTAALSLTVAPTAPQLPATLSVYARAGAVALLWSAGNPPPALASILPGRHLLIAQAALTSPGSQVLALSPELPELDAARTIGWTPDAPWDGQFALHVHALTRDGTPLLLTAATATFDLTQTTRVFTGIEIGGPLSKTAASRPDICPICGEESLRETWIYCALRNRLECPRCGIDPDDIPRKFGPSRNTLVNDEG